MSKYLLFASLAFVTIAGIAIAGAPPCPPEDNCACQPVVVKVEPNSCSGAKSCAGEGGCHGRSRTTFAERRASRLDARCAARDARAAARASCCGESQQVVVVACCPNACEKQDCGCRK